MTTSISIQYAYALDDKGVITHVSDAVRNVAYTCPGCKSSLIPVMGQSRASHFRHAEHCCGQETYLHKCAKIAFFTRYMRSLEKDKNPAILELERVVHCPSSPPGRLVGIGQGCSSSVQARYNMVELFDQADLERWDSRTGFTPDVLLSHSELDRRLYVEICVTNPCKPEKIATGIPILEFKITSEDDIQMLLKGVYSVTDERLITHNLLPTPAMAPDCPRTCSAYDTPIAAWSLSESGRLSRRVIPLREIEESPETELSFWPESVPDTEEADRLRRFLQHADPQGFYANCLRCRWAAGWREGVVTCASKHKRVMYTEAGQCAEYEA